MNNVENNVLNFVNSFNQLVINAELTINGSHERSLESLYFSICDMLSEMGFSLISRTVIEELFFIHQEEFPNLLSQDELMLSFILQLLNIDIKHESNKINAINKKVSHFNPIALADIFQIINEHAIFTIESPYKNGSSIIYERNSVINVLDKMNVLKLCIY